MNVYNLPDFEKWAKNIKSLPPHSDHWSSIAQELRNAFEQGYQLGLTKGWIIEQEKEHTEGLK